MFSKHGPRGVGLNPDAGAESFNSGISVVTGAHA